MTAATVTRILLFLFYSGLLIALLNMRKNNIWHPYINLIIVIAMLNVYFYAMSVLWRLGVIDTPSSWFFSTLSHIRSWFTALAAAAAIGREYALRKKKPA